MKQKVKIAGAGLSGLTAAINLKVAGYEPEVFEANKEVGAVKNNDWQGFENWTGQEDVLNRIKACGLSLDFSCRPYYEVKFYAPDLTLFHFKNKTPIFYLVKRGSGPECLDEAIKNQAGDLGVKINFNAPVKVSQVDIVAKSGRQPFALGVGLNFSTDLEDQVSAILSDAVAPKFYAYLIVIDGSATLVSAMSRRYAGKARQYFQKTLEMFQKIERFEIKNEKKFSGVIYSGLAPQKNKIYVGEAGGFQDYFLGFGMFHAIRSGFLAAQALIEKKSYKSLADRELKPLVKTSKLNRFIFEKLGNSGYQLFLRELYKRNDLGKNLNLIYTHRISRWELLKKVTRYVQNKN